MAVAHLNDSDLFYLEVGKGIPSLVMHGGLGFDHTSLHPWLDPLGDILHLVYYDHRGNGRSGRPAIETLTHDQFCADADALRAHLGFEKVLVLGLSYGGFIALEYALRYPQRLTHLILLETAPAMNYGSEIDANAKRKGETDADRAIRRIPPASDEEMKHSFAVRAPLYFYNFNRALSDRLFGQTVYSASAARRALALWETYNVTPRLGEIRTPTLIFVGNDDFICPPSQAGIMHERIQNSELHVFEKSGHMPYAEQAEEFFSVFRNWLRRHP